MIKFIVVIMFSLLSICMGLPRITDGVLDLRFEACDNTAFPLIGEADIYWQEFYTIDTLESVNPPVKSGIIEVPGNWNGLRTAEGKLPRTGFITIAVRVIPPKDGTRLALKLAPIRTAYRLYMDSLLIESVGEVARKAEDAVPAYATRSVSLPATVEPFTLIFHISNFDNSKGGPWLTSFIGDIDAIFRQRNRALGYEIFFIGALLVFLIVQIASYLADTGKVFKSEIPYLTGFTLAIVLHLALTGECLLYFLFPFVHPHIFVDIDYLAFFSSGMLFHLYLHRKFSEVSSTKMMRYVVISTLILMLMVLITPLHIHSLLVPLHQGNIFVVMVYQIIMVYRSRSLYGNISLLYVFLVLLLFIAAIHDIAESYSAASSLKLTPMISIIVVFAQTLLLIHGYGEVTKERQHIKNTLVGVNSSIKKFVPPEFINLLETTVEDIAPGVKKELEMTIMTADIRGFTSLSERMSPEMNFAFINHFLSAVIPVVEKYNGFINNFAGDQFTALFPKSTDDAISAAIEIQKVLSEGELFSTYMINKKIYLGIGIDHGTVILGMQGDNTRMENTILGDAATGASRLESLTKLTGSEIIVSQYVLENSKQNIEESGRNLGYDFQKQSSLQLFEIFPDENSPATKRKKRSRDSIEQVVFYLQERQYGKAKQLLLDIPAEITRHDLAIEYLLDQCQQGLDNR